MKVGEEKDVVVQPAFGYGEKDPESLVEYSRESFPSSLKLEIGESIMMRDNQSGESHRAYISELGTDTVLLDFNHPLAGETLNFSVKIAGLREPTGEELTHGHVHDGSHGH
jgi:FKBP-type peptidyl-prolyl cis-trans isomerase SlyD